MAKEEDLCRAVSMVYDAETLFKRALDEYDESDGLTMAGKELIDAGRELHERLKKFIVEHDPILLDLGDLSGIEITEIGYE